MNLLHCFSRRRQLMNPPSTTCQEPKLLRHLQLFEEHSGTIWEPYVFLRRCWDKKTWAKRDWILAQTHTKPLVRLVSWPKTCTWTHHKDYGWWPTSVMAWKCKTQCRHNDRQIENQRAFIMRAVVRFCKNQNPGCEKSRRQHWTLAGGNPKEWREIQNLNNVQPMMKLEALRQDCKKNTWPGNMRSKHRNTSTNNLTEWGKWEHRCMQRKSGKTDKGRKEVKSKTWHMRI